MSSYSASFSSQDVEIDNGSGRGQLKRKAYQELKRLLVAGPFTPGSFLSERKLAMQLGMSKTPVRAALERLEAEGYIKVSPQQGIVVREMTIQEIKDQFELREAIEPFVMRKIAGRLTEQQVERIRESLVHQEEAVAAGETQLCAQLDSEFHILFCELLGNREITQIVHQLRDRIHRIIVQIIERDPGRVKTSLDEHRAIANAVIGGDGELAATLALEHLKSGRQSVFLPNS